MHLAPQAQPQHTAALRSGEQRTIHRRTVTSVMIAGWLLITLGCNGGTKKEDTSATKPLRVIATVGMVADLAREVGKEQVEVVQLLGSSVDPHLYSPTRDDVRTILSGDIVLFNGLMLEGKMAETLDRFAKSKPTIPVAKDIKLPEALTTNQDSHHPDPHVWMDVSLWSQAVDAVERELSKARPDHATAFRQRATDFKAKLDRLHQYGQRVMQAIPQERRVLITSHDAFRYFGHAYGLEVQAIQGISTESEAGLKRINELVDLLVTRKVEAVFIESSVPKESIESLIHGAAARGQKVSIGGELFSDAMGEAGTYEGTYVGMMDHNLTTIAKALGSTSVQDGGFRKEEDETTKGSNDTKEEAVSLHSDSIAPKSTLNGIGG